MRCDIQASATTGGGANGGSHSLERTAQPEDCARRWRAAYDGDGTRRKRLDANGVVHYLGAYERNVGTGVNSTETVTKHCSALGRLVAFRTNGVLRWVGTDHLGSTIRVTDASFNALAHQRYTPFGASRDAGANLGTDRRYTGQTEDASIGLYWYGSRAYEPGARVVLPARHAAVG